MKRSDSQFPAAIVRPLQQRSWRPLGALMLALALALGSSMAPAQETSFRHKYLMRGQVLEVKDAALVVCVGTADGAAVGQELDVVRHTRVRTPPKSVSPGFRRENVGKVKITTIFDDHYAQATVVSGNVRVNDTIELERP